MFFKAMEIQGFKSFADKTVLNFDQRMTAVVGSNGNGKSNISDALRWVMGEQGAKTLRGDKMEDVIFHGTLSRKPMGYAKVALVIDNTDRFLDVDSDEVIIARKLYRSGESEYLINDAKCRLKDVQELLMGTGLGRDGYSVVGQGRVSEIINSKITQRREFFEEATGVSRFLHKKQEAERDLERSEDNIIRLKDIESEIVRRLPILEKQSEKARQAIELMEKEKSLDIGVSVYDIETIAKEIISIDDRILANEGQCEHFEREINALEKENEENSLKKMEITARQDELRRSGDAAKDEAAAKDREKAVLENEILHCNEKTEQLKQRIKDGERGLDALKAQISDIEKECEEKLLSIEENEKLAKKLGEGLLAMSGESERLDSEHRELDRKQGELLSKKTEFNLMIRSARQSIEDISLRLELSDKNYENNEEKIKEYRIKKRELSQRLEETTENKLEAENKLIGYNKLFQTKSARLKDQKETAEQLQREYEQNKSRLDVLNDIEKNMVGYASSVKAIITASRQGVISGVIGTIAEVIKTDKRYSSAIETALGSALQNIIVNHEETAKRCIIYLKETGGGRATFLPLTSVRGSVLDVSGLNGEEGFEGIASELIDCDEKYRSVIRSVLGRCAVVEDIDTATVIAKKNGYKFKIVTLDGQVINAGGSFTGGSLNKTAGIISRNGEIADLEVKTASLLQKLKAGEQGLFALREEVGKMSIEIEGFKEQLLACEKEEAALNAEIGGVKEMISQYEAQQENAEELLSQSKTELKRHNETIKECEQKLYENEKEIKRLSDELEKSDENIRKRLEEKNRTSDQITELGMKKLSLQKDLEHIKEQRKSAEENINRLISGSGGLNLEIDEQKKRIEELKAEIIKKDEQIKRLKESFKQGSDKAAEFIAQLNALEMRTSQINKEIREKIEDKEKFSNALAVDKERKETFGKENERIKASLWERYELTPSEAFKLAVIPPDISKAKGQLSELRRQISALGSVNMASIEEYSELNDRYRELKKQLDDVENAKRGLEKLIENLITDIKARFIEGFDSINKHFGRIFTEIFGGGSAHLELTDPDDILNSGIEIFAAPPGKLIKNLISLSGGEQTMVAITIYFAILLYRPTPFCMLDEVDAALDEINVVKYISYLKRFSGTTQLMVITHRRGTIEGCDVLYGVFMQEKGVSRLIRREIDDLEEADS